MIYRSNLEAPDLQPYFKHVHRRPMGHSMGHDVLSDFADRPADDPVFGLYKNCGFWTHDEAAILYNVVRLWKRGPSVWLDIGAHTGWTTAHIKAGHPSANVCAIEPMFGVRSFWERFMENVSRDGIDKERTVLNFPYTSREFFKTEHPACGVVIDGDHEPGMPLEDARNAVNCLEFGAGNGDGVIIFHDFIGRPVRAGVEYLMELGFKCRVYWTPHMVALCWRGDFTPPDHVPDPRIPWGSVRHSMNDFDFSRTV